MFYLFGYIAPSAILSLNKGHNFIFNVKRNLYNRPFLYKKIIARIQCIQHNLLLPEGLKLFFLASDFIIICSLIIKPFIPLQ